MGEHVKARIVIVSVLGFLAVSACSAANEATQAPEPVAETIVETVTPEPSRTGDVGSAAEASDVMSIEQASELYLTAVCPTNEYIDVLNEKMSSWVTSDKKLSAADKRLFDAAQEESRLAAQLLDSPPADWPEGTEEGINEIVVSLLQDVSKYQSAANGETQSDAYLARYAIVDGGVNSNSQAQLVRLRLGLPAADAEDDGCATFNKLTP